MSEYDSAALQSAATAEGTNAIIVADDDGEIIEGESDDVDGEGRPSDCDCGDFHEDADLPCWACYRHGFETVAV